jgi:hypothetical protein
MAPMMAMPAQLLADLVDPKADRKLKILDIAAGHGLYGLALRRRIRKLKSPHSIGQRSGSCEGKRCEGGGL